MENTNKNFEEIVQNLMIDEASGIDESLKIKLKGLNKNEQRLKILAILDQDRDLFMKIVKEFKGKTSCIEHIDVVVKTLREYVKVGDVEKKKFGEVMTPISLVEDMLNTLPGDVWSNPSLKWFDPCNGVGIFPCVIVQRLMAGLVEFEPDNEKRYKHILENMIYVSELQAKNVFLFMCAFDPKDVYDLNVFCGSSLSEEFGNYMKDVWKIEKFDVVAMNPPYQEQKEGFKKSQAIWPRFVFKSFDVLKENGYLVAVHPSGWRNVDGVFKDVQEALKSREMSYLEMHSFADGVEVFGAATNYDFYFVKNIKSHEHLTKVKDIDGKTSMFNLNSFNFIPNGNFEMFEKIVAKEGEEKVEVLYSRSAYGTDKKNMSKEKNEEFCWPCVYTVPVSGNPKFFYSSVKKEHFNHSKIVWGNGRAGTSIDENGDFGLTQFAYGIVDSIENLKNLKIAMDSKEFIENVMFFRESLGDRYNRKIIAAFKKDFWKEFV